MSKAQKILAFAAALSLLTGALSGCGSSDGKTSSSESNPSQAASSSNASSSNGAETVGNLNVTGLPIVNEPEEFTVAWPRGDYSTIGAAEKDAVAQSESDTNIHINFMEIEQAAWNEKVNIMLASQDLPDAFMSGLPSGSLSSNLEAFVDLTDLIPQYAPNLQAAIERYPVIQTYLTESDGSIRALATSMMRKADETTSTLYWINQSWLDAVGKENPTNLDEFYDVLVAFRDGDPNGNGQADEIAFGFCSNYWAGSLTTLFGPFDVLDPSNHVLVEDGKVTFQPMKEGFRDALEFFNKLYAEGLFDAEGFSQTSQQYYAKISQNVLGVTPHYNMANVLGDDNDFVPLNPVVGESGTMLYEGSMEPSVSKGLTITVACKHPEALVRYYDYVNSSMENKLTWNYGREGYLWELNADGSWNQITDNLNEGEVWDRMRYVAGFGPSSFAFFDPEQCALVADRFVETRYEAVKKLEPYYPAEPYHAVADDADVVSEKNLLKTEIDAYITSFIADSIMKGIDDASWQKHLATCESLNVDRYVELMQIPYDKFEEMTNG